jgi:hypothetical protein
MLQEKVSTAIVPAGVQRIELLRDSMEEACKRGLMQEFEPPLEHLFCSGLYARRNYVPAGMTVITKVHAVEHITIVLYGKCHVYDHNGKKSIIDMPNMWVTKPGTLRAIHCETDTSWITVHPSDKNSVEEAEHEIFTETFAEYQARVKLLEVTI